MFDQHDVRHMKDGNLNGAVAPGTDPRLWAHTPQHLVEAFLSDAATGLIVDAKGAALAPQAVRDLCKALSTDDIGPGDVVLVKAENTLQGVAAILAVWLRGATVCPVDPAASAEVVTLIGREIHARALIETDGRIMPLDTSARHGTEWQRHGYATGDDLGMVIFTSGSSGRPKGVMLSNTNIMTALRSIAAYLDMSARDRVLCIPPMFLDYGVYQVLFTLFSRSGLVLGTGIRNPITILELIKTYQPTIIPVVPALASGLTRILNTFSQQLSGVRLVCNTGGHLAPATVQSLRRAFPGVAVVPMYGLTETKRALFLPAELVDSHEGSVGGPMPGLDARVVVTAADGALLEAEDGQEGELYLRGSSVMQGYHAADAGAGARIVEGRYRDDVWLATGDLFVRDADGCLYFRGRSKALVKQRGYCLYPRDIEAVAEAHPQVRSAVMIGRTEPDGDESAVLFIVPETAADPDGVRAAVLHALPVTLQPRFVHFLPEWPPSPVGKIDLNALHTIAKDLN
ncbi:acyl-CoA synthetase (AMP-forming)/AMP-acid ligase II [Sagittula marina]|uniref:Acyl-CoA synthetase (AMP-forming)/AMP-acid ligase II n=1 Tax=Sagittula marina TaxID=943940 RepID=A0A7W6GRL2_9RHOB|nr:class I adenylate-forming enzyme family protein [Sagittula marina]MBB3984708.1 acyl-CoA synthetase (AMP-forming)/AMP-acid ligase II [Sagittula marina]